MNRLAQETSPYLLQHAENPVDWWPWGEAAFAEARRRDWCEEFDTFVEQVNRCLTIPLGRTRRRYRPFCWRC